MKNFYENFLLANNARFGFIHRSFLTLIFIVKIVVGHAAPAPACFLGD
jgi:hypothetical protein